MMRRFMLLVGVLVVSLSVGVTIVELAPDAGTPPHCRSVLTFIGLKLSDARALALRCNQGLRGVLEVPDSSPRGTVVSESLPYTGNELVVSTGPLTNTLGTLRGAAGPPVTRECAATIHLSEDGNAGPLTCNATHVNVEAWDFYASLRPLPPIMGLPRSLSTCQIVHRLVNRGLSTPENVSAFVLANVYNGWHVPFGYVQHVFDVGPPNNDTCPHA